MKRPNTAIEDFIANYSTDDVNTLSMNVMDDFYDFSDNEGDAGQITVPVSTNTTSTTSTTTRATDTVMTRNTRPYATPVKKSRYQMLCEDPEVPFAKAIAGAMLRDLEDVYIREDLDRAIECDYDLQVAEKQRQGDSRRLKDDIERLVVRIDDEKKKLIGQAAIDTVIGIEEEVAKLRALVFGSDIVKYTYEDLWRDIAETELVLTEKPDKEALTRFMEQYYIDANVMKEGKEKANFKDEFMGDDNELQGIAVLTLRKKIGIEKPVSHQLAIEYLPRIVSDDTIEAIKEVKKEAAIPVVKKEPDAVLFGMRISNAPREPITPHHDSYPTYMSALFNARDNVMARNELTRNVNLAAIHDPILNERIKALSEPTVLRIIDTSRDYFRELYHMNATPVEQYEGEKEMINDYTGTVYRYQQQLVSLKDDYDNALTKYISDVIDNIGEPSALLNNDTLRRLASVIQVGEVTQRQLAMSLIKDASFRVEYQKALKAMRPSIESSDKKKFEAFRETVQLFVSYCDYIMGHDEKINENLVDMESTLHMLREKELQMLRDETDTPLPRHGVAAVAPPIELRPDIRDKIDEAYLLVQRYCANLRGLPLSVIKSTDSLKVGLGGEFARYVAALYADCQLSYQDSYKSVKTFENVAKRKSDVLVRLREYTFSRMGNTKYHIARSLL